MVRECRDLLQRGVKIIVTSAIVISSVVAAPSLAIAAQTQTSTTGNDVGASGTGNGGNGQDNGNGNGTSKTDNGVGNGGVDNGQGSGGGTPTSIPESPFSIVYPLALGAFALIVYRKKTKPSRKP